MFASRILPTIVMLTLASLYVSAQTKNPATNNQTDDAPKGGAITGKVVNESGQPLANARVSARAVGAQGPGQTVTTDRDGAFQMNGLDRAAYIMNAGMAGYTTPPRDPDNPQTTYYHVGDSVTFVLIKGGVITGTVTDWNGDPLIALGVRVQMIRDSNGRRVPFGATLRDAPTDDRGVYRVYGLPGGTYLVMTENSRDYSQTGMNRFDNEVPTYAPSSTRDTAAEVTVRAGEEVGNIDIRYRGEPGHIVSGSVTGPGSELVSTISLTVAGDGGTQWNLSAIQPPGSRGFSFNAVADGEYQLTAHSYFPATGERTVSQVKLIRVRGADVTGVELTTRPLGSVAGRVVLEASKAPECADKRRPLFTETLVSAWHNDNDAARQQPSFVWSLGAPVYPDAEGNVLLRNLAPGQYYFEPRFSAKYWYLQSITLAPPATAPARTPAKPIDATRVWVNVKSGDRLTGLTITIAQGAASLRGQLALGEGQQAPPRLFVHLIPAEREKADEVLRYVAAPVSPEGKIALNNIAPGHYWVLARPASDEAGSPLTKLRLPEENENRAQLRRDAEAAKNEIEFKPCQNVVDFQLPLKPREP